MHTLYPVLSINLRNIAIHDIQRGMLKNFYCSMLVIIEEIWKSTKRMFLYFETLCSSEKNVLDLAGPKQKYLQDIVKWKKQVSGCYVQFDPNHVKEGKRMQYIYFHMYKIYMHINLWNIYVKGCTPKQGSG